MTSDSIHDLRTREYYWNQVPKKYMNEFLQSCQDIGYREALRTYKFEVGSSIFVTLNDILGRYISADTDRAKFMDFIPLPENPKILDLGSGWGAVLISIAQRLGNTGCTLFGTDVTKETLAFIDVRARQENIDCIKLYAIDPLEYGNFPFEDDCFDLVILNGVLEWVGKSRRELSPTECQLIALQECYRVSKPGGSVYIGIENSRSYLYYLGSPDHSGLPFVVCLPRWLANVASQIFLKEPYRTYVYTQNEYRRMLERSKFANVTFRVPVPDYRDIGCIVECKDEPIYQAYREFLNSERARVLPSTTVKLLKLLIKLPGLRKHAHCYSIIATKPA
jgi:ubiquinone/menaquinone biosynthesis C-methylase UbiE